MIVGPAMIIDDTQTIVVVPGAKVVLTSRHLIHQEKRLVTLGHA
jgi:N-methylhydantoinase A/oxoprolinase/acetone carboxylase beta subunit